MSFEPMWEVVDGTLAVTLPDRLPVALTLRLSPSDGIRPDPT